MTESSILFAAGNTRYRMVLSDVAEVVESPRFFPIPLAPPFLSTGINFHGELVPLADLKALRGEDEAMPGGVVIVLDRNAGNLGIRVDRVVDMFVRREPAGEDDGSTPAVIDFGDDVVSLSAGTMVQEIEVRLAQGR